MRRAATIATALTLLIVGSASAAWQQPVGGASPINVPTGEHAFSPSITSVNGVATIAWNQNDDADTEVYAAQLTANDTSWTTLPTPPAPVDTPDGNTDPDIASVGGVLYVSYQDDEAARVARLSPGGASWAVVGSPLNHDPSRTASEPDLAGINGTLYATWSESEAGGTHEIRAARLNPAGTAWVALVGNSATSPIQRDGSKDAIQPSLVGIGGQPYVAWSETDNTGNREIRVARLSASEGQWERLEPAGDSVSSGGINESTVRDGLNPSLTEIGGVPYLAWSETDGTNTEIRVARRNADGTAWEQVVGGASPINKDAASNASRPSLTAVGGVPYIAWLENDPVGMSQVRVAFLNAGQTAWERVADAASPINHDAAKAAVGPKIANVGGVPYVAWEEPSASLRQVRVSRIEPDFEIQSVSPGSTTAELNATWRTYGLPFQIGFDYGASLENATAPVAAPAGQGASTVTQSISGLTPSSVYQMRSFAIGPTGAKTPGANATVFQTSAPGVGPGGADTTPPETTITKEPANKLEKSKAKYKFTSSEPNSTFVCKFDKKKPKPCDSGKLKLKRLDDGKHKFRVYAVDAAGNADRTPAKDKFKVL